MGRSIILLDNGSIGIGTLDQIVQAVVFFADSVAVRASYDVPTADRTRAREIARRLDELREPGFVVFWAHEYEVDDSGRVVGRYSPDGVRRPADLVVERGHLQVRLGEMDELLRSTREEAYLRNPGQPYRQGIAEVVKLRAHLTSLVVSAELSSHGLLSTPSANTLLAARSSAARAGPGSGFRQAVAREVVERIQLGRLSALTIDQIRTSRGCSSGFRRLLDDSLISVSRGMDPIITPGAAAAQIVERYQEIKDRFGLGNRPGSVASDAVWDVAGIALPATVLLKYAMSIFAWKRTADELRPFLMLLQLEKAARQHGQPNESRSG